MIIFTLKRTQVTLSKLNTSPEYQGMSSRAFSRKVENRLKMRFSKNALELNSDKKSVEMFRMHFTIEIEPHGPWLLFIIIIQSII